MGMNASTIISDDMTLEEKLAAIDQAMANAQAVAQDSQNNSIVPDDPQNLLMCEGCQ